MHVIIWQYRPRESRKAEFEEAYGPEGVWARLFRKGAGFAGTELLRESGGTYITIDRWDSRESYDSFHRLHGEEYRRVDLECEALTESERKLGEFDG